MKVRIKQNLGIITLLAGVSSITLTYADKSEAAQRKALIIANASYPPVSRHQNLFETLNAPKHDAILMGEVLREHGFHLPDSQIIMDGDKYLIIRSVKHFVSTLQPDDIAMIYFTGHGIAINSINGPVNYLLPSKPGFASKADIEHHAISAQWVLDSLSEKLPEGRPMLVLDACRNSIDTMSPVKGLKKVELISMEKTDALVVYSTKQGTQALGNVTGPSVFTKYFAKNLRELAHRPISETLRQTRTDVSRESKRRYNFEQIPWEDNGFRGDRPFCFAPQGCQTAKPDQSALIAVLQQRIEELERQSKVVDIKPAPIAPLVANTDKPIDQFKDRLASGGYGPVMVSIPAGIFQMGDIQGNGAKDEKPVHTVKVPAFAMGKYEVTNEEYVYFLNKVDKHGTENRPWFSTSDEDPSSKITTAFFTNYKVQTGFEAHPVTNVSWYGAKAYVSWLSQQTGQQYRLPSEREWEYAARANSSKAYSWGERAPVCNEYAINGAVFNRCDGRTRAVNTYRPNAFSLHHMHGNVLEWVEDCYSPNYNKITRSGYVAACYNNMSRALRGGSWYDRPGILRSASRSANLPRVRNLDVGFRVVRSAP